MRIAVIGYYGYNNFGDEINLQEMIKSMKAQYPKAEITVYSRSLWHAFLKPEYNLVIAAGMPMETFQKTLNQYDVIVIGGGGLIFLGTHFFTFLDEHITAPYIFSRIGIDDRTVNKEAVKKIKNTLHKASHITVRTHGDLDLLKKNFDMSCDVVPEAIWNYRTQSRPMLTAKKKVIISLNVYAGKYTNRIKAALSTVKEPLYEYIMSMQDTTTDCYYNIKATNRKNRIIIPDSIGLDGKGSCLASVDLTITSRLHAALVSISHGVPAVMLKSTPKLKFLAAEMGLDAWHCNDITGEFIDMMLEEKRFKRRLMADITADMRKKAAANMIP